MDVNAGGTADPLESTLESAGTSGDTPETPNPLLESGTPGAGNGTAQTPFEFGGRKYESRQAAEKAFGKLYGEYGNQKGILNTIKAALKDPELLQALSQDPQWADILGKLGIEAVEEEVAAQEERAGQETPEQQMQTWKVEREVDRIEREEYRFERALGRSLTPQERRDTLLMIRKANSLSYEEAFKLSQHDRLLSEARKPQVPNPKPGGRPPPPPVRQPGSPLQTKKAVNRMSEAEWKENLRSDPEIAEILSKRDGQ